MTAARTAHCAQHRQPLGTCPACQRARLDAERRQLAEVRPPRAPRGADPRSTGNRLTPIPTTHLAGHGSSAGETDFRTTCRTSAALSILVVHGKLDIARARMLEAAINDALAAAPERLVIDLRSAEFVDSAGLATLVFARRRMGRQGVRLTLVCDVPSTLRVLERTGLARAFEIHPTHEPIS